MFPFKTLLQYFADHPKKLFLWDGIGAFLTACSLTAMASLESYFGMPRLILSYLALLATGFGIYSMVCSSLVEKNWIPFIYLISTANILYCLLTAGLVVYFFSELTLWGILYFGIEILVVSGLVMLEQKTARSIVNKNVPSTIKNCTNED